MFQLNAGIFICFEHHEINGLKAATYDEALRSLKTVHISVLG